METPPRTQMASYLERWEQQKAQSRRDRQQRRRSSDVGDELSFISAIERETAQEERYDVGTDELDDQYKAETDDSFDLPALDAFPASKFAEQVQKMPREDEFVDAATFLKKNELGGDDSFSEDVGALAGEDWDQMNSSGRPSDFFERKSRNLDHVELSSPRNVDDPLFDDMEVDEEDPRLRTPKQQLPPTGPTEGVALRDRFNRGSSLSESGTALSLGYDVHFDTKFMLTPNSMKYLQEKSRFKGGSDKGNKTESDYTAADYTGEARTVIEQDPSLQEQETAEDPSPEYVANLAQGPGVIKESLHEIDALIDNSIPLASSSPTKDLHGIDLTEDMREFVREYERPLESMLPLSRTTDSWGEDASISQIDDDASRRSRESERLSSGTEPYRQTMNGVRRSRSQETPELDTICEVPCPSNTDSASRSQHSPDSRHRILKAAHCQTQNHIDSNADHAAQESQDEILQESFSKGNRSFGKPFSGVNSKQSDYQKSRATSVTLDQSLADVAATQNPFRDQIGRSKGADIGCVSEDGAQVNRETGQDQFMDSEPDAMDRHQLRFRYGEHAQQLRSVARNKRKDDQRRARSDLKSRTSAVHRQPSASDKLIDVLDHNKLQVTMDAAMIPRRCRRFLCSVGDIMTEQIVFTNGANAVGRICVSLLPLSTGCQQFSVSPAVLELGPKASSAFHVTFNARYAGAVSGIFQFRGVGIEALFHPYEVVIEASVRRYLELETPKSARTARPREEANASERVQELQASSSVDQVEVSPMFIRFDRVRNKSGELMVRKAILRLSNNTAETLPFQVRALENLRVRPATGMIQPASDVVVSVLPISQPFVQQRAGGEASTNPSPRAENWFGSLTVRVGKSYLREVSVVVDRRLTQMLPPFDEIARSRHQLSSQTDSFYYTKRGKRRGLYFHARAVEFGCCNVGESHEVPVYVCNGSKTPVTVFLQDLQEPFSSGYSTTTIEPRKFIEVMVTFTPKVVGKVATSLFAYSVNDKAVVTLVARGI
ncbi:hypothetical protein PRIC2_000664 [Phytophthora ramorum]